MWLRKKDYVNCHVCKCLIKKSLAHKMLQDVFEGIIIYPTPTLYFCLQCIPKYNYALPDSEGVMRYYKIKTQAETIEVDKNGNEILRETEG